MLRLRTTSTLSLLALVLGVAGTGVVSMLTAPWRAPAQPVQRTSSHNAVPASRHRMHTDRTNRVASGRVKTVALETKPFEPATTEPVLAAPSTELIPVSMPPDMSQPWQVLRGHLDGSVLMHLQIDGRGEVRTARMAASSGDPVLDEHALRSVRSWRFAVPVDHPEGVEGDLPMRFASADPLAATK